MRDSAELRRLQPPFITRRVGGVFNRWRTELWMAEPGRASRYRCLFTPRTGRRGPLPQFERTDSLVGTGLPARH